jgi:hypothetical protein
MFTYYRREMKDITKLFKETDINTAFQTTYTVQNIVKPHLQIDEYAKSGIYQLRCMGCPLNYIGLNI